MAALAGWPAIDAASDSIQVCQSCARSTSAVRTVRVVALPSRRREAPRAGTAIERVAGRPHAMDWQAEVDSKEHTARLVRLGLGPTQ